MYASNEPDLRRIAERNMTRELAERAGLATGRDVTLTDFHRALEAFLLHDGNRIAKVALPNTSYVCSLQEFCDSAEQSTLGALRDTLRTYLKELR
jgi:hypothetical protein